MTVEEGRVREAMTGLIVRATAVTAVLTVLGSLLGLLRDLLLARFFGATSHTDAFVVAWTVPETASPLLIEGAMALLMIPIFVRAVAEQGGLGGVVRASLPRIGIVLAVTTAAVTLLAPQLVDLLAPGLAEPDLAIRCMRVTAVTVLTFGLAGYLGAALRSSHVFGWPASIYVAYNVGILGSMALFHEQLGVFAAAIGVAVGSVLMVAAQTPAFLRRMEPAAWRTQVQRPHVALIAFIPIGVYTVTRHAQVFVERFLGSELSAGTISHLNYAQKVAQVPMVLSIMVATVTFPMLARSVAIGDDAASREHVERDLRMVSAVVLVASAYIIAYSAPIIGLLFEHGAFSSQDTNATSAIMRVYAFGLLGQAVVGVLCRSYFSEPRSVWYPALVMAVGLAVTALIGVVLLRLWQGMAIAAGNAAGITLTAALMLWGLPKRGMSISVSRVAGSVAQLILLAGVAGAAGRLVSLLTADLPTVVTLIIGGLVVCTTFLLLATVSGVEETRPLVVWTRKLLGRAARGNSVPFVLMYHAVSAGDDPHRVAVSPNRFAEQMQWLKWRGLRGTSMRQLLDAAEHGSTVGLVGLTFDDGYADFTTNVMPVLARHGFTATVFVVAGKLGGRNDWDDGPSRALMTAGQVRDAARQDIEIGSHGVDHRRLLQLDDECLSAEMRRSRVILQSLTDTPVRGFCYPYGEISDATLREARAAGYDYAVAVRATGAGDRHALPRTYVGDGDGPARLLLKEIRHRLVWKVRR
jgi:putative peptidoglycan lipid II flippase